jgi:hypothetical protein
MSKEVKLSEEHTEYEWSELETAKDKIHNFDGLVETYQKIFAK